jgi:hypothetical protein
MGHITWSESKDDKLGKNRNKCFIFSLLHFTFENSPREIFIPELFSKQYRN